MLAPDPPAGFDPIPPSLGHNLLLMAPLGGVERPRRVVRFARLIQRRVRDLGGPAARAASGGDLSLPWLPLRCCV
jgi:hypothetical protein